MQDRSITERVYTYCLAQNMDDGWAEEDQHANFQKLLEIATFARHPLKGASVLDVGCGTGDLVEVLQEHGIQEYLGIDLVKPSIGLARTKHPQHVFEEADFLEFELNQPYDFVLASGTLALRLETDNYAVMEALIEKMWESARHGVAFNFLSPKHEGQTDDALFLYEIDRILSFCRKAATGAAVEHQLNHAGADSQFLQAHVYLSRTGR
ncbi:class I SAM-dependent methyltransferase [Hyalangium versicolor]|uniref:class I SAM-dependent methyltransferase n=1 Tax=Hyalangium versicolor TaxID=2861190 RepID=UPI001CCEDF9B|nr:class I SAM-dependent methyltransferase [Hyalangium versicolor]